MILGQPTKLESQFRLKYSMILNLLRTEDFKVEDMIKRSFSEFHTQSNIPEHHKHVIAKREKQLSRMEVEQSSQYESEISAYYDLIKSLEFVNAQIQERLLETKFASQNFVTGRVVIIRTEVRFIFA